MLKQLIANKFLIIENQKQLVETNTTSLHVENLIAKDEFVLEEKNMMKIKMDDTA